MTKPITAPATVPNASATSPGCGAGSLTRDGIGEFVRAHGIKTIMLGVPDLMGRLKGKTFDASHFLTRMQSGAEMCSYILATDAHMTPLNGFRLTGWHDGYGDLTAVPDPTTLRRLTYLPHTALILADAHHHNGTPIEVAPRQMLRRQIDHLADLGYTARVGIESEFLLYRGSPHRLHHNGYRTLIPVSPHNLDYALDHPPALTAFLHDLRHALHQADAPVEAIKTEGAPGQIEVTWPHGDPMRACDTYTLHKHAVRAIAAGHRMTPTFMAAPQTGIGSGLHFHVSLWRDSQPAFRTAVGADLPDVLQQSLAGLLDALPEMAPLYAPYPNSYKRYTPHSFAPVNYTWGYDNRTCAIRLAGRREHTRLEVRLAGADANPYLTLAAILAAIFHGITKHPDLPHPIAGDAYDTSTLPEPYRARSRTPCPTSSKAPSPPTPSAPPSSTTTHTPPAPKSTPTTRTSPTSTAKGASSMPDLLTSPASPGARPLSASALPPSAGAQWDAWYTRDARMNLPLTNTEIDLFHQHVDAAPGMLALDAGCGTGHWSRLLANTGLGVLGMDASPTALALARRQGSGPHLHYARHDFNAGPIPPSLQPGTFDLIICRNTLPYIDQHRFLTDAARWLTSNGQLHLTIPLNRPDAPPPPPWAQGLTAREIRSLGAGWQTRTDYPLGPDHVCIVLTGHTDHRPTA